MTHQTRRHHLLGLVSAGALLAGNALAADAKGYFGTWSGTLSVGSAKLRLKLVIAEATATIYSLDQGNAAIPASKVGLGDTLTLEFAVIGASYVATLSGDTLKGTFTQGGQPLPLEFARGDLFAALAPPPPPEALTQAFLGKTRQVSHAPAIGAAYARGGTAATILVDGVRSSEADTKVTAADQWHLGSITKSMTATLVARLAEAGGITWDTTVADILGGSVKDINDSYRRASFRHLCSHHAGLQANIDMADLMGFSRADGPDPRAERLKYAALALKQTPVAAPGEKMLYSNNGYIIAGAMLEAVHKKPWEELISQYVFAPLGLKSAGFGAPGTPGKLDQPLGHTASTADPAKMIPATLGGGHIVDNPVALGPAGRVHMALDDLVTYLNAHLRCPESFLKAGSWKTLHTPPYEGNYAMGWVAGPNGQIWHNGSNTMWYAEIVVDPARQAVAAAACNDGNLAEVQPAIGAILKSAVLRATSSV